jgi:hypothetical protein
MSPLVISWLKVFLYELDFYHDVERAYANLHAYLPYPPLPLLAARRPVPCITAFFVFWKISLVRRGRKKGETCVWSGFAESNMGHDSAPDRPRDVMSLDFATPHMQNEDENDLQLGLLSYVIRL